VKAIDMGWQRSYFGLFVIAVALALIASHPRIALVVMAYTYTVVALVVWVYTRLRRRPGDAAVAEPIISSDLPLGSATPPGSPPSDTTL